MHPLEPLPTPTIPTLSPARPRPQRVIVAEVTCLLCARPVGTATADRWPPGGSVLFQPAGAPGARPLAAWWRLRCPVCGGNTAASELVVRTVRVEPPTDWQTERPRRGRPPRWAGPQN